MSSGPTLEVFDFGTEAAEAAIVHRILEMELFTYFEDLEDDDLFSRKHCKTRRAKNKHTQETDIQLDALMNTVDGVWTSLVLLAQTSDLGVLNLPYIDTKEKQEALAAALRGPLNQDFLVNHIRAKWPVFLDERLQRKKNTKSEAQQENERRRTF